jgi:uncharacterized protein
MERRIPRRDFLKSVPAAGMLAYAVQAPAVKPPALDITLSGTTYPANAGYSIQPKPFWTVTMRDAFWQPKIRANAEVTIPFEVSKFADADREFSPNILQAAIYSLQTHPDAKLQAQVDASIRQMTREGARDRGGNRLFEVAAAYFVATGKRDLLDPAIRNADAIYETQKKDAPPFSGGERDAINCVALYLVTREKKHLDLAKYYLDIRGLETSVGRSRHNQSYKPPVEQREAVGHAVNCASLMVSLADVGVLTGLKPYFEAANAMWLDAVSRKMYVTGGIGSTGNEGFGEPYVLPNISAYAETCAVLMFTTLNHKLFLATGDAKYIDVMERGMYNNTLSGVSAKGDRFFYVNRLSSAGDGRDARWEKASLECCPPNLVRFMASMPGYIYAQSAGGDVYVNLYVSSESTFDVGGKKLTLSVESEMPWGGKSTIAVSPDAAVRSVLKLRIPGWARNRPVPEGLYAYRDGATTRTKVAVNGTVVPAAVDRFGYVSIDRTWAKSDVVTIEFPFEVRRVAADRRVTEDRGKMAIERGPMVFCAEWPDCEPGQVFDLLFDPRAELKPSFEAGLFGGATVLAAEARSMTNPAAPARAVRLVPYHLWANRGVGEMSVWLSTAEYQPGDVGPSGGLIFYVNPNYQKDGWRFLEAAPFDQSAGAKWGCFRSLVPGARGTAIGTGRQNTADMLAGCAGPGTAADLCAKLSLNGVAGWFLPSRDELALMYKNLKAKGLGDFLDGGVKDNVSYWASSQQTADMAAHIDFADLGRQHGDDKDFPRRVRAIRAF